MNYFCHGCSLKLIARIPIKFATDPLVREMLGHPVARHFDVDATASDGNSIVTDAIRLMLFASIGIAKRNCCLILIFTEHDTVV